MPRRFFVWVRMRGRRHIVIARSAATKPSKGRRTVLAARDRYAAEWRLAMTGECLRRLT
jgi:hypothetical protein